MSQQPNKPNDFNELYTYYSRLYDFVVIELEKARQGGKPVPIARYEAHRDMLDNVLNHFEHLLFPASPQACKPALRLISGGKNNNNQQEKKTC